MNKLIVLYIILLGFVVVKPLHAYFYDGKEMVSILKTGGFYDYNGNRISVSFVPGYEYAGKAMDYGMQNGLEIEKEGMHYIGDGFVTMFTPHEYIGDSFMYAVIGFGFGIGYGLASPFIAVQYGYEGISDKIENTNRQAGKVWQRGSFGYLFAYPGAFLKNTSRIITRTSGSLLASTVGVVGGVGIVAPLSLTLPVGALLLNPVYGLGKISYGTLKFTYGLTAHQALGGIVWPTTICAYNTTVGAPFILVARQANYRRVSGNFMKLDKVYSVDYQKKLAFEDSISLQQLTEDQESKLFSLIIDKESVKDNTEAQDSVIKLMDSWSDYRKMLEDSLKILYTKEPKFVASTIKNSVRLEPKINQLDKNKNKKNSTEHLASVADQFYLSKEEQFAFSRNRIKKALEKDSYFKSCSDAEKRQVIDSLTLRLNDKLTSKFGRGSQRGDYWTGYFWSDLFGWFW